MKIEFVSRWLSSVTAALSWFAIYSAYDMDLSAGKILGWVIVSILWTFVCAVKWFLYISGKSNE